VLGSKKGPSTLAATNSVSKLSFDGWCDVQDRLCWTSLWEAIPGRDDALTAWTCDHIQAVINGGANRERNLHPLCEWCEPPKTEADVHEKSRSYRRQLRHAGIKLAPKGRPLPGTLASGWKHRMDGGWERRPP
jgi:HNH endonuclease